MNATSNANFVKCSKDGCSFNRSVQNIYCGRHQICLFEDETKQAGLKLCSGYTRGCREQLEMTYLFARCSICIAKANANIVKCAKDGCSFKRSVQNTYCGKHQICLFEDETKQAGLKLCSGYIRGCREQLEMTYLFTRCSICLAKDREKDKSKRDKAVKQNTIDMEQNRNTVGIKDHQICTTCCRDQPIDQFEGRYGQTTKTCKSCRDNNKVQEEKRDKEHVKEMARRTSKAPHRVDAKRQWKEDNFESVASTLINSRKQKIDNDLDGYLKTNAENAKKWRDNNPDKVQSNNENKRKSLGLNYGVYERSARDKNIEFAISYEQYVDIVMKPCYYCGIIDSCKGFNGIDRRNQMVGYNIENSASCCSMCNYMKGCLSDIVFVKRIEHILLYGKYIKEGAFSPELFADHKGISFTTYKRRAFEKDLLFEIEESYYCVITSQECYICGKNNNGTHKNGMDRIDNGRGYVIGNISPCCGECNYMKNSYKITDFFNQMCLINNTFHIKHTPIIFDESQDVDTPNLPINKMIVIGNKKSAIELKESARIRKQNQRENLKKNYGDAEYNKIRAAELSKNRALKRDKTLDINISINQNNNTDTNKKNNNALKLDEEINIIELDTPSINDKIQLLTNEEKETLRKEKLKLRKRKERENTKQQNSVENNDSLPLITNQEKEILRKENAKLRKRKERENTKQQNSVENNDTLSLITNEEKEILRKKNAKLRKRKERENTKQQNNTVE